MVKAGWVIGHRGAAGDSPENTLAGLGEAARRGCRWVEVDAKLTADGIPVLFHDDTLERTTNGRGAVASRTLAELGDLDAGAGETIPTLADALNLAERLGLGMNVELKPCPGRDAETGRRVTEALVGAGIPLLLSSFSETALLAAREMAPGLPRALLVGRVPDDWRDRVARVGAEALHCRWRGLRRHRIRELAAAGVPVRCYTVNDPDVAARLFSWGVAGVFSDFPGRLIGKGLAA
jgi:glycerophosphoryl diester phosphodiesterase